MRYFIVRAQFLKFESLLVNIVLGDFQTAGNCLSYCRAKRKTLKVDMIGVYEVNTVRW